MIRRPPRSTLSSSSAASDVYKRQHLGTAGELTEGNDRDRPRMVDVFAPDLPCFAEVDGVAPNVPDHALEHDRGVQDRTPLEPVYQVNAMQDLGIQTHCATKLIAPQQSRHLLAFRPRPDARPCGHRLRPRPTRRTADARG